MSNQISVSKGVSETISLAFEFQGRLLEGETLTGGGCVVSVLSGVDPSPSSMLVGGATQNGTEVVQQITGGLPGVIYVVSCQADTSELNILIQQSALAVVSENPFNP